MPDYLFLHLEMPFGNLGLAHIMSRCDWLVRSTCTQTRRYIGDKSVAGLATNRFVWYMSVVFVCLFFLAFCLFVG